MTDNEWRDFQRRARYGREVGMISRLAIAAFIIVIIARTLGAG